MTLGLLPGKIMTQSNDIFNLFLFSAISPLPFMCQGLLKHKFISVFSLPLALHYGLHASGYFTQILTKFYLDMEQI
jgi:hypothetical protein